MIEKLERHTRVEKGLTQDIKISCPPEQSEIVSKINELVDAVNEIMTWRFETDDEPAENSQSAKIAQDPYEKERKWIGKLCRFWDEKEEEKVFGILTTIDSDCWLSDMCPYWNDTTKNWFEHCEPVKDDIIYKGGDNDSPAN